MLDSDGGCMNCQPILLNRSHYILIRKGKAKLIYAKDSFQSGGPNATLEETTG